MQAIGIAGGHRHVLISGYKIILKHVLVTLYAILHRFQYCWFSSVLILFFLSSLFSHSKVESWDSFFFLVLSTLSLSHVFGLFELYAHERCKSRYCTKSLWHEYWTEIFNTWSKYRNNAVAYLFLALHSFKYCYCCRFMRASLSPIGIFCRCFNFDFPFLLIKIIKWNKIS